MPWSVTPTVAVLHMGVKHGLVVERRQAQHAELAVQIRHVGVDGRAFRVDRGGRKARWASAVRSG